MPQQDADGVRPVEQRQQVTPAGIPEAAVARLPLYLRALDELAAAGRSTASSEELAAGSGVTSAKVRKDLSHLGPHGTRGVGYDVELLAHLISRELGLTRDRPVVIVGAGHLGQALAGYGGFARRGFRVAALLDADPRLLGEVVGGVAVAGLDVLEGVVAAERSVIAVIATPADAAQQVCDRLVAAGVRSVLNFAPCVLAVPDGVRVREVDLSTELQILAFHEQRSDGERLRAQRVAAADGLQAVAR